jgi:hypothetical protein
MEFGFGVRGVRCGVWSVGCGVWGVGFGVWGSGCGVLSLEFGVGGEGLRFEVWGWAKPVDSRGASRVQDSGLGVGGLPGVEEKVPPSHRSHEGEAMASWKDPGRQGVQREAPAGVREECVCERAE